MDVFDVLRRYVSSDLAREVPVAELSPDTPLISSGLIDSIGIFRLIAFVEERFDVQIDPEEVVLDNFATLAALRRLIESKLPAP